MKQAYQLSNIQQHYNSEIVLQLDDYSIESNKSTALVGPNGSGKSTLLDLLAFISRPDHGSIMFYDQLTQEQDYQAQRLLLLQIHKKIMGLQSIFQVMMLQMGFRNKWLISLQMPLLRK